MPTIPVKATQVKATNADYLNSIRTMSSDYYRANVPEVQAIVNDYVRIGSMIVDNPILRNEFYTNLANQFAFIFGTSKVFRSRYAAYHKGVFSLGELVEEYFVEIAKPNRYNPAIAETEVFKRVKDNIHSAIYETNVKCFYKSTIQEQDLRACLTREGGVYDLIGSIIQSMSNGREYDDMNIIKYLLGRLVLDGKIKVVTVPDATAEEATETTSKQVAKIMKENFDNMTFPRADFNYAGVINWSEPGYMRFMLTTKFGATYDIDVLSAAFQLNYANFMGQVDKVDDLTNVDFTRLNACLVEAGQAPVAEYTSDEISALKTIVAFNFDEAFMQIYTRLIEWGEMPNREGLYWNNWLHFWGLYASSPFAPAVAYATQGGSVTGVEVSPTAVTLAVGASIYLEATVEGTGFFSKDVTYESSAETVTVDANGRVHNDSLTSGTATITVKSKQDPSKTATCTITGASVTA